MELQTDVNAAPVHGIVTMPFTPYYDEDGITIYNADCKQVLPFLPRVDLLLTDPPFGINRDKGMGGGGFCGKTGNPRTPKVHKGGWDSERPSRAALEAVFDAADKHYEQVRAMRKKQESRASAFAGFFLGWDNNEPPRLWVWRGEPGDETAEAWQKVEF